MLASITSPLFNFAQTYTNSILTFAVLFILFFFILFIVKTIFLRRLYALALQLTNSLDSFISDLIKTWNWGILVMISAYISFQFIELPAKVDAVLNFTMGIVIGWVVIQSALVILSYIFTRLIAQRQRVEPEFDPTVLLFLRQALIITVWIMAILVVIQNLGYEISALVGGLGLGGLAVAFAVQNVLSDVFSSISIYFDRPFKIGDYIVVGEDGGVVKKIGIKSTRLTTLQGQELVISNKELTESRVHNYKKMVTRRVVLSFGIEYGTSLKKLKQIPALVQAVIEKQENVTFSRCHCKTLSDSSIRFEAIYTVTSPEFTVYMDAQQAINFAVLEIFEKQKIEIAYSTQRFFTTKE